MTLTFKPTGKAEARLVRDLVLLPKKGAIEGMDEKVFVLNDVAGFIWQLLADGSSDESILKAVLSQYKTDEAVARKDLTYFIQTLIHLELIKETAKLKPAKKEELIPPTHFKAPSGLPYRHPKIYVYNLQTEEEAAFGPHVRGASFVHRAIAMAWHGGCC